MVHRVGLRGCKKENCEMSTIEISHVSQLIEFIETNQSKYIRNQHFLYRGESRIDYTLLPSVYRMDNGRDVYLSKTTELHILNDYMTEAASYINLPPDDFFRWLQYAQHFGAPTRLLDWTSNPLVALYFACTSNKNEDGRIYVLNSVGFHYLTDEKNKMDGKLILEEAMKMIKSSEKTFEYPALFKPYYFDKRMSAQSSQFMVWGYRKEPLNCMINELEISGRKQEFVKEEIAPGVKIETSEEISVLFEIHIKGDKKTILRELDWLGVNQASLFPGLDGIGRAVEWRNNSKN